MKHIDLTSHVRLLTLTICLSASLAAQPRKLTGAEQLHLAYPKIDLYRSVVLVDDANGIFLNPAAGGFQNTFSLGYTGFIQKDHFAESQAAIAGIPFLGNVGYRRASDQTGEQSMTNWFIGSSTSTSKDFSFGSAVRYLSTSFGKVTNAWSIDLGFISRISRGVAIGYSFRNIGDIAIGDIMLRSTHDFGIGIRPLGDNRLTITADGSITSKQSLREIGYKFGADLKLISGIHLFGTWRKNQMLGKSIQAGLSITLPNIGILSGGQKQDNGNFENAYFGVTITGLTKESFAAPRHQIAEMKLKGVYNDYTTPGIQFGPIILSKEERGVRSMIDEVDAIAKDEGVDALVLHIESFSSTYNIFGMSAAIHELGNALQRLRDKGKKIIAYLAPAEGLGSSVAEMYLASYANTIFMSEYSSLYQYGIAYNSVKLKNALKKALKIDMRTYTAGKYKSSLNELSDTLSRAKVDELNSLIDDLYGTMIERISSGRKLDMDKLSDTLSGIIFPEEALALGVVDKIGWYDDAKKYARHLVDGDTLDQGKVKTINLYGRKLWAEQWGGNDRIAVIGIYGPITTGKSSPGRGIPLPFFSSPASTGSETVAAQIQRAESDPSVKAIVLRVDSPGGSAVGSDEIYRAIGKVKKPVVVSMGDLAASGGYYVSCFGKKIFASPTTLTASIGVIGQIPFLHELVDEFNVYVHPFNRGKYSGALNVYREPTPEFEEGIHRALDHIYQKFLRRIHQGRKIPMDTLQNIAQGKIYTGQQAKRLQLIDEHGGLYDAIQYLKTTEHLTDAIEIEYYPVASDRLSSLINPASIFGSMIQWLSSISEPKIELR